MSTHFDDDQEPMMNKRHELADLLEVLSVVSDEPDVDIPEAALAEAESRWRQILESEAGPSSEAPETGDLYIIATVFVEDVEAWLAATSLETVRSRGNVSVPPVDLSVPALEPLGFGPAVDLDAEVNPSDGVAAITVGLDPGIANPRDLEVVILHAAGASPPARFDRDGYARVQNVPLTAASPSDLRLILRSERRPPA